MLNHKDCGASCRQTTNHGKAIEVSKMVEFASKSTGSLKHREDDRK